MSIYKTIAQSLASFQSISLQDLDCVSLLNRIDTKFVVNIATIPQLLNDLKESYSVLEIDDNRFFGYSTVYYDTPDNSMYLNHLRGKLNRFKVRHRVYLDSGLSYLEVKFKNNKQRTIKWRTQNAFESEHSETLNQEFLKEYIPYEPKTLTPALKNVFKRITLVNKAFTQRLTIDLKLGFNGEGNIEKDVWELAIIEVKSEKNYTDEFLTSTFRKNAIKPAGFSKYCVGRSLVAEKHQKHGNIKTKLIRLNKIANDTLYAV